MKEFDDLVAVMARLRGEGGCPWDRRQTHRSLLPYLVEETSETADAIESGDPDALCEELGDLLLQIVFHAQIGAEQHEFTIREVVAGIRDKLLRRHPHVFGSAHAETPDQVVVQWEEIKKSEKKGRKRSKEHRSRSLEDMKNAFPADPKKNE
jgi:tetrapyrrole methylase family protein/MazG family protein